MIEIRKTDLFARWLDSLRDLRARARVLVRIERLAAGNPGDVKAVGEGVRIPLNSAGCSDPKRPLVPNETGHPLSERSDAGVDRLIT